MSEQHPNLTPYRAAQVTNAILKARGDERTVRPQMLYGYAKKGTIATVETDGKVTFNGEAFKAWLDKYLAGEVTTGTVDIEKLAENFQ